MSTIMTIGHGPKSSFRLPEGAVTETFGVLGKRGTGKTHTASVLTEELLAAKQQVVVLDPLDVWWGLRSSADGQASGLAVYVFGGEHADLPLDGAAGKLVADVVVEQGISVVLSLRHLSKSAQRRFVADFAERLYERKGVAQYRTPLHLVIDEADAFAPQRAQGEDMRMLGAIDTIVRRGRSSGLGVTLISQRAAVLSKDVLTQIEVLIVHRTLSPQDRKALEAWIEAHDSEGHRAEFMSSLASLEMGEAWIWSPSWLDSFERVRIRSRKTFDSSSTPKAGDKRVEPARLAAVDIEGLRGRMAAVVKEAEANDPRKLRARIMQLEKEVATKTPVATCDHTHEIAELTQRLMDANDQAETARHSYYMLANAAIEARAVLERADARLDDEPFRKPSTSTVARTVPVSPPPMREQKRNRPNRPDNIGHVSTNGHTPDLEGITGGAMRMLQRLAERHPESWTRAQLATLAKVKKSGGTFGTYYSRLYKRGLIIEESGRTSITDVGLALVGGPPPSPQSHDELIESWRAKMTGGARRMLDVLLEAGDEGVTRDELAARAEVEVTGGSFGTYLSRLVTNGLAEKRGGVITATDVLLGVG